MGILNRKNKAEKKMEDEGLKREREVIPVAEAIIKMIAEDMPKLGTIGERDIKKYEEISLKVIELILKNNLKYRDKAFLFQLALQPIDKIKEIVTTSLSRSFDAVIDKVIGKDFQELTLNDMDKVLKSKVILEEVPKV